jgi:HSP20 family protein
MTIAYGEKGEVVMSKTQRYNSVNWPSLIEQGMDELFGRINEHSCSSNKVCVPLSIWTENEKVYVELDLPGVDKESLSVSVHEGVLNIQGARPNPDDERDYTHQEIRYGNFHRAVRLSDDVDEESVTADLKNGVLKISLSKKPEVQPKKIEVKFD